MKEIPMLSTNLIQELADDEANLEVHHKMSMEEIMYKGGRWSVLNELLNRLEYYNNLKQKETEIRL